MRLTQHTDYALRVLVYLGLTGDRLVTIQEISDAYGISKNHLMKVVQRLVRGDFVESTRGQKGGLRLKAHPTRTRVGDVVRYMEPDLSLVECFRDEANCVLTPACRLRQIMQKSIAAFLSELDRYTIGDLLDRSVRRDLESILHIENA